MCSCKAQNGDASISDSNHHDSGYKELFSYPELVQQLIEGFSPPEIAALMDFSTLQLESGHYITPLFEEKRIDKVVTRWLKRHFHRLGDTHNWERIHSLTEDHAMITENLKTWAEKERAEGMQQGIEQGYQKARIEAQQHLLEVVLNMLQAGLPDEQVMSIAKISAQELAEIKAQQMKH